MLSGSGQATSHPQSVDADLELSHFASSSTRPTVVQDEIVSLDFEPETNPGASLHGREDRKWSPSPPITPPEQRRPSRGIASRVWGIIMSRNPLLLMRSSPALGTGSYGAVPMFNARSGSEASSEDEEEVRRTQRRNQKSQGKRVQSAHNLRDDHGQSSDPRRRYRSTEWLRRRSSSAASDIGMGLDSKTSFAVNNPAIVEHKAESSNASTRTGSEDEVEQEDVHTEDDPPDNSPYPEVRASVPATDNTSLSINTPRMWTLSLLFAIAGSATNLFFSLRYPSVAITPVIALVLVHPLGKLWDLAFKRQGDPEGLFVDGTLQSGEAQNTYTRVERLRLWLAQGRWNEKEHACVYISSNVSFGFAFATDVIVEQHKFYKQAVPILYQLLLTISTQILGYAFAGLTRRYLVRPAAMIWPGTLMSTAMFTTMHKDENKPANGWKISRYRFFIYVWTVAFTWYFVPGLLAPALSYFSVITWFAPKNVVISNLVGNPHFCARSR